MSTFTHKCTFVSPSGEKCQNNVNCNCKRCGGGIEVPLNHIGKPFSLCPSCKLEVAEELRLRKMKYKRELYQRHKEAGTTDQYRNGKPKSVYLPPLPLTNRDDVNPKDFYFWHEGLRPETVENAITRMRKEKKKR